LIDAFNQRFADPATGTYHDPATPAGTYQQHENAMPLGLGLVPQDRRKAVGDTLAADVRSHDEHLTTGIMGTRFLFDALSATGHVDDAFAVATQTTYPSYGHWIDDLHWTGLGENWEDTTRSRNHQMYGSIVQWFFSGLAGITPTKPGFAQTTFRPMIPSKGLDHIRATVNSVRGRVAVRWDRTPAGLALAITVPPNGSGVVFVPAADRAAVAEPRGATFVAKRSDRIVYRVAAGTYRFRVR
jgi:alpha-L-rhamnosidase